jgi:hypothetical protein
MAEQVDQRRDRRIDQRDHRRQDDEHNACPGFPPGTHRIRTLNRRSGGNPSFHAYNRNAYNMRRLS